MLYENSKIILFHFHITYRGGEGDFSHFLRSVIYRVKSQQVIWSVLRILCCDKNSYFIGVLN